MRTRLVVKLIAVLVLLLAVVLYKMNDFYKQERIYQAETIVKKQFQSIKTSVASQLASVRNVLSTFDVEIKENQINWVQLDPFFGVAKLERKSDGNYQALQYFGRSGTIAEKWSKEYVERALTTRKPSADAQSLVRLFKDRAGGKYIVLIFSTSNQQKTAVFGPAEYFQKFFDDDRGSRTTSALMTTEHILAAHTESEYVATLSEEADLSEKKYILEKQVIAGTNLIAMTYTLRSATGKAWVVPWSMVGLVFGFGFVLIGLLYYGLDPLDKKIERYKKQERDAVFKETLKSELQQSSIAKPTEPQEKKVNLFTPAETDLADAAREETVSKVQEAFSEPTVEMTESTMTGPLQQALFNLDAVIKESGIRVEKDISTRLTHEIHYGPFIKVFENILRNSMEALENIAEKKIAVRAYDIGKEATVIEIQDNGTGLMNLDPEKVWQPFFTTKPKSKHMGLGLTEALSIVRRCHGDLILQGRPDGEGVSVKLIMKTVAESTIHSSQETAAPSLHSEEADTVTGFKISEPVVNDTAPELDLDLDKVLSLDDEGTENLYASQKVNVEFRPKEAAFEKPLSASEKKPAAQMKAPNFSLSKKSFLVDEVSVNVRRPDKS